MKLTKIRAGYYEYEDFFVYQETSGWWHLYQWENKENVESRYILSGDTLRLVKAKLELFFDFEAGV